MQKDTLMPVIAGLAVGVALIILFATLPIPDYPIFSDRSYFPEEADYTPLLQLGISGLRDEYRVGEGVDFSVRQTAGGICIFPQLIMITDLDRGTTVKVWNGTEESAMLLCPIENNPAKSGTTWSTIGQEEKPILLNQTGSYAVLTKHLFKTVMKEFKIIPSSEKDDTSPEIVERLSSSAKKIEAVTVLLDKYPDANFTVTANYYSKLFREFEIYHPSGIVQYSVARTDLYQSEDTNRGGRELLLTVIFDRYYENNTPPLTIIQCKGENSISLSVSELPVDLSEIKKC